MEEELAIARSIQQGFLPRKIPDTPGLKVAAKSVFCLEVAGDYYDVISFKDTGTLLAVGDVAGKGAGAALLMANLQASLRTAAAIGVRSRLGEVVARINNLIFNNTSPDQYITFFAGYYRQEKGILTYVNAGHNPPLLVRKGEITLNLDKGGLILGCLEDMQYEHGEVKLKPNDLLVLFTDGVSEAMNADEEEFGVERIEKYITANAGKPVEDILAGLENEILTFCGDQPLLDDFTLMLVRVEG
jgi:sigma-B regulation protein RsbU (phosphoserine phosphatase)